MGNAVDFYAPYSENKIVSVQTSIRNISGVV